MRSKADRDMVLANSFKLDRYQNEEWRVVNVVADLTYQQRKSETKLKSDAQSKNLERSEEDIRLKKVWKVLGKRGARRLQQVLLRQGELVDQHGNVMEEAGSQDRRKRRFSGGSSPSQGAGKKGKVQAADFGVGKELEGEERH